MRPEIYQLFEHIFVGQLITGPVIEVGCIAGPDCLLNIPAFNSAAIKIGVNIESQKTGGDILYVQINANDLSCFKDSYFQAIVCNSTLEHDPLFWRTLSEIYRVAAQGCVVVIGVPGYAGMDLDCIFNKRSLFQKIMIFLGKLYDREALSASALTLGEHHFPGDYYRFSEQAVREVFFSGFINVKVYKALTPPRFVGVGYKP